MRRSVNNFSYTQFFFTNCISSLSLLKSILIHIYQFILYSMLFIVMASFLQQTEKKNNSNYKWTIFVIVAKLSNRHTTSQTTQNISLIVPALPYIDIFITNYNVYGLDYYRDGEFGWRKEPDTLANRYIKDSNKMYF